MKSIISRAILVILLFTALPAFSEQYYGWGAGINNFTDNFPKDNYIRQQLSVNFIFSFYYFPDDFPLGVYAKISSGWASLSMEANNRESMKARKSNVFENRIAAAPSFRMQLGSKSLLPISIGPTIIFSSEETSEDAYVHADAGSKTYRYQSVSGGITGDIAFIIIPGSNFFIRPGLSFDYIFLRTEKGEMRMNYRTTHNSTFRGTPYYAFNTSFYFGLGRRF
ncbi:MAG: hypothetical protein FWF29_03815 [Treponema sp.]|nr:hypothetical protein [Treponema sp.]